MLEVEWGKVHHGKSTNMRNRSALEERSLLNSLILFRVVIYFSDLISWIRSYDILRSWFTKLSDFALKIVPAFLTTSHDCFELSLNGSQLQEPPSVRLSFHTVFGRPHSTSTRVMPFLRNRYPFSGCWFILTDPNGFSSRANGYRLFPNGYAVQSNGLMLTANGYMSFANGCTIRSNGPMLTSNGWAYASNVLKKTF